MSGQSRRASVQYLPNIPERNTNLKTVRIRTTSFGQSSLEAAGGNAHYNFRSMEIPSDIRTEEEFHSWARRTNRCVKFSDGKIKRLVDIPLWPSNYPDSQKMGLPDLGLSTVPVWAYKDHEKIWKFTEKSIDSKGFGITEKHGLLLDGNYPQEYAEIVAFDDHVFNNFQIDLLQFEVENG